jgi:hypothetical protein
MSDPLTFTSASPRFGLPLLFAGQAQKEVFVNEAHALTDSLLSIPRPDNAGWSGLLRRAIGPAMPAIWPRISPADGSSPRRAMGCECSIARQDRMSAIEVAGSDQMRPPRRLGAPRSTLKHGRQLRT